MKPGIYDISNDEYHGSEGLSKSGLSLIKDDPLFYWDKYLNPNKERDDKKHFMLGSAVNTLLLEPDLWEQNYFVRDPINLNSKKGREYSKEILKPLKEKGVIIIEQDDFDLVKNMVEAVINHPHFFALTNNAKVEKSIYWIDEETGLLCKSRPDIWNDNIDVLCDLKTSADGSYKSFLYDSQDYDYHMQAAMQIDAVKTITGKEITEFYFLVSPKKRPFYPYLYHMDQESIEYGRSQYKAALRIAKKCIEHNSWGLYRQQIAKLNFSEYRRKSNSMSTLLEVYECQS